MPKFHTPSSQSGRSLAGTVALVTGAGHGMGRNHAIALARRGARVGALDIDATAVEETASLAQQEGWEVRALVADVADDRAVRASVENLANEYGGLDAVISNAGVAEALTGIVDTDDGEWARLLAVHVNGAMHVTRAAVPWLLKSESPRIVLISSMWAQRGPGYGHAYAAAKGALLAFGRNLAVELGPSGVCVNSIAPGSFRTRMADRYSTEDIQRESQAIPLRRWGRLDEISEVVCFLASPQSSYVTGQTLAVNGGEFIGGF